jgi:hypothetical protein
MRRYKQLAVSKEIHAALAEHLGPAFHQERLAAHRSRTTRYIVIPVALAAMAALLFAIFHR